MSKQSLQRPPKDGTEAFAYNAKKGRRPFNNKRRFSKKGTKHAHRHERKKKDVSEIQCYDCNEFGHYASRCPHNKKKGRGKGRQHATATEDVPKKKSKKDDFEDLADGIQK